jgi:uncharacterized membrane protein
MQTFGQRGQTPPVTPGRPAVPQPPSAGSDLRPWTIAIWALYLASLISFFTAIPAVIIAYAKRQEAAGTIYESHMTYAIRTFWIGLIVGFIGGILMMVMIGLLVVLGLLVWLLIRYIRGLACAIGGRPIVNPEGWL